MIDNIGQEYRLFIFRPLDNSMSEKTLFEDIIESLNRPFSGGIPTQFSIIDREAINELTRCFDSYRVSSVYELNYVILIEDIMRILHPNMLKAIDEGTITDEDASAFRYNNRVYFVSTFLRDIQDRGVSIEIKLEACFYFYTFLDTFKKIHGVDLMDGHDSFMNDIKSVESELKKDKAIQDAYIASITQEKIPEDEISPIWRFSFNQLSNLSDHLCKAGFVDTPASFLQSFYNNAQFSCNWRSSQKSLMFLIQLIHRERDNYKLMEFCDFISLKFTFRGKSTTERTLRESLRNVESKTQEQRRFLDGDYGKLYDIYTDIFP